jgi:hypothetical protein
VQIDASEFAENFVERRGGRLYVWFEDVGRSPWVVQRVRFWQPDGVSFTRYPAGKFDVYLQADLKPPGELRIRRRPWPVGPIDVTGTGAGEVEGAGGGGADWSGDWPSGHGGGEGGGGGGGGHGGH